MDNMGFNNNGMGYDPNNEYNQNGGQPMGGVYPPQQGMGGPTPMQQQQMMQQQRFGGMQQGYGMNQQMPQQSTMQQQMSQQPMQHGYGMPQQQIYDPGSMAFGSGSSKKQNQVPIIIAIILVLVVGGVLIWLLVKGNNKDGDKKTNSQNEIEIKAPSRAFSGDITNVEQLKKYYEDNYNLSFDKSDLGYFASFSKDIYLNISLDSKGKLKGVVVGDQKKRDDVFSTLLAPFADTSAKKTLLDQAFLWMNDGGLVYDDRNLSITVGDNSMLVSKSGDYLDTLIELKGNNKFTLSTNEFDNKKYTVDVQHYSNNFKKTFMRTVYVSDISAKASFDYSDDGYTVSVAYIFYEDYVNNADPSKGGKVCYTSDNSEFYVIKCTNYISLGDSKSGNSKGGNFFEVIVEYTFDKASTRDQYKDKAIEYFKKLNGGVKVVK